MKRILFCVVVSLSILMTGCKSTPDTKKVGDNKPVAPETYSDDSGKAGDPKLPEMKPWWRF